ncbi:MAG: hypothetical protein JW910_10260, partial [Anaerolineae bacterium]|nr:hypothetical protein [Anaerolineae bacterium]
VVDPAQIECPFKGLEAFQETDAHLFFGREDLVDRLLGALRPKGLATPGSRFLAVVGASGSGKSSLIRAGLIPALRAGKLTGSDRWPIVTFAPGPRPTEALATRLLPVMGGDRALPDVLDLLARGPDALHQIAEGILADAPGTARLVLFVDQFEEVFSRASPHEAGQFLGLLHTAATIERGRTLVVLTMRADFFDRLSGYPDLAALFERERLVIVTDMTPEGLRRSIEGPAEAVGLVYDAGLPDRILEDVRQQPGSMPLLQYALKELFERRDGRQLTQEAYQAIGGVQNALAQHAEAIYTGLDPAKQDIMRRLLLRLVEVGASGETTRRKVDRADLTFKGVPQSEIQDVIDLLTAPETRLLVASREINPSEEEDFEPATWIEIGHEALIRNWTRFAEWIAANEEELRYGGELLRDAREWQQAGQSTDYLLGGTRLARAVEWLETADANDLQRAFVQASAAEQQRRDEEERQRQAKELELEREARQAKERQLQAQQRFSRRLKRLAVVLAVLAIAAAGFALFAFDQRAEATTQRDQAESAKADAIASRDRAQTNESRFWLTQGRRLLNSDPVASINYLLYALPGPFGGERPYLPEAEFALTEALNASLERAYLSASVSTNEQIAFSPDAIAVGGKELVLTGYDLSGPTTLEQADESSAERPCWDDACGQVRWSDDGAMLSYVTHDARSVQVWQNEALLDRVQFDEDLYCAEWQPGSRQIALCGATSLWLWTPESDRSAERVHNFVGDLQRARWSPDGRWLAAWDHNAWEQTSTLLLWDSETRRATTHDVQAGYILDVVWSPDSRTILVLEDTPDFTARLWPVEPDRQPVVLEGHTDLIEGAIFLDDSRIMTWSYDGTTRLWSDEGESVYVLRDPDQSGGHMRGVVPSEDGSSLFTFLDNGLGHIWNTETGAYQITLRGHSASIVAAAWRSPYLVTTSADQTARIWDTRTGDELIALYGHTDRVLGARW